MIKIINAVFSFAFFASVLAEDPQEVLKRIFPSCPQERMEVSPLKGGMSGTALYKVKVEGVWYVLRIHQNPSTQDLREHHAFLEASKMGIAPEIVYISQDHRAILMEYIEHPTLMLDKAKLPENGVRIAKAIKSAHEIQGHTYEGESLLSKAGRCAEFLIKENPEFKNQVEKAYELLKNYRRELDLLHPTEVEVHADLNPRNIFVTSDAVLFIDWAETTREDPFYDLSYFSQKMDYSEDEESFLLTSYLDRGATPDEMILFRLQKKIHQAFWCLTNLYLAQVELKKNPTQPIDFSSSLKSWRYYQDLYADPQGDLSFQYFYDLSRLNYLFASLD